MIPTVKIYRFVFDNDEAAQYFRERINKEIHFYFNAPYAYHPFIGNDPVARDMRTVYVSSAGNPIFNAVLKHYLVELATPLGGYLLDF